MANKLIDEQSPYLLQHAHNPVDWYPWGDEAFERAAREHKPVLVSIGYAACHWCHVMERESFENEAVAAYMNEHFINIKVDREEHPDVDHMYMDAVQAISGSGGWPLNVFVTPERIPFYGGTYFPPRAAYNRLSWTDLLQKMNEIWQHQQTEITAQTDQMLQYLRQTSLVRTATADSKWDMVTCRAMADKLLQQADKEYGGFGAAPKFPGTMAITYLLEHFHFTQYEPALQQALLSLDAMIAGGIYDQIGGGFARYSTDKFWLAPHFEKMLYDNALLIMSMCDAYSITGKVHYKKAIEQTIEFIERELKDPAGGYYCALDADSEGVEGKYYTWTWEEWQDAVGDEPIAAAYYGVTEEGNWEETNILHQAKNTAIIAAKYQITQEELAKKIETVNELLLNARAKRIRPLTDDKCLLSWNALMNMALSKAGVALHESSYITRAKEHMSWMLQAYKGESMLLHTWKNGTAKIPAKLDDYAYLVQALLQMGQADGDTQWVHIAATITEQIVAGFLHEQGNFFYYTHQLQTDIPVRKVDMYDGALPSANAVMAQNLNTLGLCMDRSDMTEQAEHMLRQMVSNAEGYTYSFSQWALQMQRHSRGLKTVCITGNEAQRKRSELLRYYIPNSYVVTSEKEIFDLVILEGKKIPNKTYIFVCTQTACLEPQEEVQQALRDM
jgi:uncharacterized protein YyaL (SSP411 family)